MLFPTVEGNHWARFDLMWVFSRAHFFWHYYKFMEQLGDEIFLNIFWMIKWDITAQRWCKCSVHFQFTQQNKIEIRFSWKLCNLPFSFLPFPRLPPSFILPLCSFLSPSYSLLHCFHPSTLFSCLLPPFTSPSFSSPFPPLSILTSVLKFYVWATGK